jgi:hypothetical protein
LPVVHIREAWRCETAVVTLFTAEYPRLPDAARTRALRKSILEFWSRGDSGCSRVPEPLPEHDLIDVSCAQPVRSGDLTSIVCHHVSEEASGRSSGAYWSVAFDERTGKQIDVKESIRDAAALREELNRRLLAEYDLNGADSEYVADIVERLVTTPLFAPAEVHFFALEGNNYFDITMSRAQVDPFIHPRFRSRGVKHGK